MSIHLNQKICKRLKALANSLDVTFERVRWQNIIGLVNTATEGSKSQHYRHIFHKWLKKMVQLSLFTRKKINVRKKKYIIWIYLRNRTDGHITRVINSQCRIVDREKFTVRWPYEHPYYLLYQTEFRRCSDFRIGRLFHLPPTLLYVLIQPFLWQTSFKGYRVIRFFGWF